MVRTAGKGKAMLLGLALLLAATAPKSAGRVQAAEQSAGQMEADGQAAEQNAGQAQAAGSIELQLPAEAAGVTIALYQAALPEDGGYVICEEFSGCEIELKNLNDSEAAEQAAKQLAVFVKDSGMTEEEKAAAGEDGRIRFEELQPALYLTVQTGGEGKVQVQPALIPIPHMTDGMEVYDAVISPKYSILGGAVILTKTDEDGEPVGQAHFVLQSKVYADSDIPQGAEKGQDEAGSFYWKELQANLVSNGRGQLVVRDLPPGDYRFVEVQAPKGFVLSSEPQEFTIDQAGTVKEVSGLYRPDSGTVPELTIVNRQTVLRINKVDPEGAPVSGARLVIQYADGTVIRDENGEPKYSFTTTDQPFEVKGLPAGDYLIRELEAPDGYKVAQEVRVTVSDAEGAVNEVTMIDERQAEGKAGLTVRKNLVDAEGIPLFAQEGVFYAALFADEERTQRITDVQPLYFHDDYSQSVTFDDLEVGKTYYVGETDEDGEHLTGGLVEDCVFEADFAQGYEVALTPQHRENTLEFKNVFHEIPHNYYYHGEITVTKKVMKGEEPYSSDDIYYAAVFEDEELTQIHGEVIALEMNGGSEAHVTVPVQLEAGGQSESVYYVAETDQDGNVLDPDAVGFQITIDHPSVTLSAQSSTADVIITNTYPDTPSVPSRPGTPGNPGTPSGGTPVKTGDTTPALWYLILLILSAAAAGAAVFWRVVRR